MKFFTLEEILEEKMKIPGYAERLERASQELEAEFAAERASIQTPPHQNFHNHSWM